ncbi:MAG TPA: thioredoxin domain-containing protein [Candidatus Nitrosopolaris sp.]|nr:thioredoxin domain-containing protein [Candidatus Nitrosopolaris sp.]
MDKRFLSILGAIIIIFVGIFVFSQHSNNNSSSSSNSSQQPTSHIEGQGQAGVTLVEYGDYECPICGLYYPVVKQVETQFSSQIYFQFRNLPLTSIHKNAFAGARAAEAAGLQGKYWQMHDALYDNQDPNGTSGWVASDNPLSFFTTFAQQIGLNVNQFKTDYNSDKVNNAINADLAAFAKTGQEQATPTFFLDGKYISNLDLSDSATGQPSVQKFAQVINAEIAAKKKNT